MCSDQSPSGSAFQDDGFDAFLSSLKSDTKWLSWLAYQFHIAVGAHGSSSNQTDDSMDLAMFKKSFFFKVVGSRSVALLIHLCVQPELADCLFNYLDTDKTGRLTLEKFIRNLEFIIGASDAEKVAYLFKIFDRDGTCEVTCSGEISSCLSVSRRWNDRFRRNETVAALLLGTVAVVRHGRDRLRVDRDALPRNGHRPVGRHQSGRAVRCLSKKRTSLQSPLTDVSIVFPCFLISFDLVASASSWIRPKPAAITKCHKSSMTVRAWTRNNIDLIFFWSLYTFICLGICVNTLHLYVTEQRAHFFIVIARLNGEFVFSSLIDDLSRV